MKKAIKLDCKMYTTHPDVVLEREMEHPKKWKHGSTSFLLRGAQIVEKHAMFKIVGLTLAHGVCWFSVGL